MQAEQFDLHAQLETRHWWFVGRRQILQQLVRHLVPPAQSRLVIDVGCGTGANIASLVDAYRTVGIDTSEQGIAHARLRFPSVQFICGQAPGDLGPLAHEADLTLLTDVLEHVPDDFAFLSQLLQPIKPGGYLLLTVPADMKLWSQHDVSFGHYRRYDRQRLQQTWEGLPVRCLLLSHFNSRLYPIVRLIRTWNQLKRRSSGDSGTDFNMPGSWQNRMLTRIFAGESASLLRALRDDQQPSPYRFGVSLVAVLQRLPGELPARHRPPDVAADPHEVG